MGALAGSYKEMRLIGLVRVIDISSEVRILCRYFATFGIKGYGKPFLIDPTIMGNGIAIQKGLQSQIALAQMTSTQTVEGKGD